MQQAFSLHREQKVCHTKGVLAYCIIHEKRLPLHPENEIKRLLMRLIHNPWLGMDGYNCYGCCPTNPLGTHLSFYEDGDDIVSVWRPTKNHQSWINTLHGGIQAVLLDEICGWVVFQKLQTAGVTAKMETRYHKPVSTQQPYIVLRGRIKEIRRNVAYVVGEIWSADKELLCECVCTYFTFPQEKAKEEMYYVAPTLDNTDTPLADLTK